MNPEILVDQIVLFHQNAIITWKNTAITLNEQGLMSAVEANHAYNYQLWQAEDRARRQDMGDTFVVTAKREIDTCNQKRNNQMENMDEHFMQTLNPAPYQNTKVHSETPGMMIDRLSILSLKIYHMDIQAKRQDVDASHRQACEGKLSQLQEQRNQLANCLKDLLIEIQNQTRTFRVYKQHKMYNDPKLNPELYQNPKAVQV
jgi:hypothetical protein